MRCALPALLAPLLLAAAPPPNAPGETAITLIEGLTTEVGQRLAATAAEARARDWAVARLRALGFQNVRVEPFTMTQWQRGEERAEVIAPVPQRLAVTALGGSPATPRGDLVAPVVGFDSLAALEAAAPAQVAGKIVFVTHRMTRTQDGSSYGFFGDIRRRGPALAGAKGAAAIVIRSIGTDSSRAPHTGQTNYAGGRPIPAAALSVADAEQLERLLARGPVTLRLSLATMRREGAASGNVIAEVPGSEPAAGIVLVGAHLDSWDLGTGAIDDAAGVGIVTGAARTLLAGPRPRRTVRLVLFGAEEPGLVGGLAYLEAHRAEPHALATEADFGGDRVWRVDFKLPEAAAGLRARLTAALAPLGIAPSKLPATGDSDIGPLVATGVNALDLQQDGTRYFDLHHTAEDTFDKLDPAQVAQVTEAYARVLRLVADAPEDLLSKATP